jgi:hypothetical protein
VIEDVIDARRIQEQQGMVRKTVPFSQEVLDEA